MSSKLKALATSSLAALSIAAATLIVVTLAEAPNAEAQALARVVVNLQDTDGNPIKDVEVKVTTTARDDFEVIEKTDKKGRATLAFKDGTLSYRFDFSAVGYQPANTVIKPAPGGTIRQFFTLPKLNQAQAQTSQEVESSGKPDPDAPKVLTEAEQVFNAGVEMLRGDDMEGAKQKFIEAASLDPDLALVHSGLASLYLENKDYALALQSAQRLSELEPDAPLTHRLLYEAYQGSGDSEKAAEELARLKELDKSGDTSVLLFNEGAAAARVGDNKRARSLFGQALEVDPTLLAAHSALAIVLMQDKAYTEAIASADEVLRLNAEDETALRIRYDAFRALGDEEQTAAALSALAAANPEILARQAYKRGYELFQANQLDAAMAEFKTVISIDAASFPRAHYYMGLCHVNKDQKDQARTHLQKFLDLAPDDDEAAVAKQMLGFL